MDELVIGCDVSNYTGVPTAAQVAELAGYGLSFAFVGTSYWQQQPDGSYVYVGEEQCAAFEAAGWPTGEYQFPYRLHGTQRERYVDAEQNNVTIDSLRNALREGCVGPYTRRGFAASYAWDCPSEFPGAKLFDARYIGAVNHGRGEPGDEMCLIKETVASGGDVGAAILAELAKLIPFAPYWGFTEAEVTQWHDTVKIADVSMDLNVRKKKKEDDVAAIQLIWNPDFGRLYVLGQGDPRWVVEPNAAAELQRAYGAPTVALSWGALVALGAK